MPEPSAPTCALQPCPRCGRAVIWGMYAGQLLAVEPAVQTYVLLWQQADGVPRLAQSRGYVAHQCEPDG